MIAYLKSLFSKSNIWASLGTVFIDCFMPVYRSYYLVYMYVSYFLLKTVHLKLYNIATMKISFSPLHTKCSCCCLLLYV